MDAEKFEINSSDSLPTNDNVYRFVLNTDRDRKNKLIPAVRCFTLSEADKVDDYRLSVEWDKKTTPEEILIRVGLTFKGTGPHFKDYSNREVFSISIGFLNGLDFIVDVIYDPFLPDLPIKGKPSNPAHSLVAFKKEDYDQYEAQIFTEIRNHAKDKKMNVDMGIVTKIVEEQRNI